MQGDLIKVTTGQYWGSRGFLEYMPGEWMWALIFHQEESLSVLLHPDEASLSKPCSILHFSWETGYNVTVGDTLQVAQRDHYGSIGVVKSVNFLKAEVRFILEVDGM